MAFLKRESLKIIGVTAIVITLFVAFKSCGMLSNKITSNIYKEGPHIRLFDDHTFVETDIYFKGKKFDVQETEFSKEDFYNQELSVNIPGGNESFTFKPIPNPQVPPDTYDEPSRTAVVSDLEGDFEYFKEILLANEVVDGDLNWIYGDGHLVIVGDVFDRGPHVTECLWLIYKLDQEALASGGQVHMILGNHESMALKGDHRYLHRKYKALTKSVRRTYRSFYAPETILGEWLRTKNAIEKVGPTLYVHGGININVSESDLSVTQMNDLVRKYIDAELKFKNPPESDIDIILGYAGPLWYRGYVDNTISQVNVDKIISRFDVSQIIVGHSIVNDLTPLFNRKIFAIDVPRHYLHDYMALLIEDGKFYKIDTRGQKTEL